MKRAILAACVFVFAVVVPSQAQTDCVGTPSSQFRKCCGCPGLYVNQLTCRGLGYDCDPFGGGLLYCCDNCYAQNASDCRFAPSDQAVLKLKEPPLFETSSRSRLWDCSASGPGAFEAWLARKHELVVAKDLGGGK